VPFSLIKLLQTPLEGIGKSSVISNAKPDIKVS